MCPFCDKSMRFLLKTAVRPDDSFSGLGGDILPKPEKEPSGRTAAVFYYLSSSDFPYPLVASIFSPDRIRPVCSQYVLFMVHRITIP